jgi:hypothetical protein
VLLDRIELSTSSLPKKRLRLKPLMLLALPTAFGNVYPRFIARIVAQSLRENTATAWRKWSCA